MAVITPEADPFTKPSVPDGMPYEFKLGPIEGDPLPEELVPGDVYILNGYATDDAACLGLTRAGDRVDDKPVMRVFNTVFLDRAEVEYVGFYSFTCDSCGDHIPHHSFRTLDPYYDPEWNLSSRITLNALDSTVRIAPPIED